MASAETKADCEALMSALLPVAERRLSEQRILSPFGCTLSNLDELAEHESPGGPHPLSPESAMAELSSRIRELAERGQIKASGLAHSILAVPPGGGEPRHSVRILLDHRDDYSVVITFPYHWLGSELVIDEPHAAEGAHATFGS